MLRIEYNDPDMELDDRPTNWGGGVYLYKGQPFTGIKTYHTPNTNQLVWEYGYKDGILDGRRATYWPNGTLQEEYFQKYDYCVGAFKRWDEQGNLISHQEFDENGEWVKTIL